MHVRDQVGGDRRDRGRCRAASRAARRTHRLTRTAVPGNEQCGWPIRSSSSRSNTSRTRPRGARQHRFGGVRTHRALDIPRGTPCEVVKTGGTVRADWVVVATHYPILDRGLCFAQLEAERSYCIAARVGRHDPLPLAIDTPAPKRRCAQPASRGRARRPLAVCGARRHWPVEEVTHRWSAQDPPTYDRFPMVRPHYQVRRAYP